MFLYVKTGKNAETDVLMFLYAKLKKKRRK
jgi:hypothetical protein